MAREQEPKDQPAELRTDPAPADALTLVDYFDQIERAAFCRALDYRDNLGRPQAKPQQGPV